jgi:hypothetical protein
MPMFKFRVVLLIIPLLMMTTASPAQALPSDFRLYNGLLFRVYYPAGWTVNQTGNIKQGTVMFHSEFNDTQPATVYIKWYPLPPLNWSQYGGYMNRDHLYKILENDGTYVMTISNDSWYASGHPALHVSAIKGDNEFSIVATHAQNTIYNLVYVVTINDYPAHLNQFEAMVATFHIHE